MGELRIFICSFGVRLDDYYRGILMGKGGNGYF